MLSVSAGASESVLFLVTGEINRQKTKHTRCGDG
jgi:hypothetical protein